MENEEGLWTEPVLLTMYRGSNAINNEHAFRGQVKAMYFDVGNQLVISNSK